MTASVNFAGNGKFSGHDSVVVFAVRFDASAPNQSILSHLGANRI
jgi:hypothetical protein